MIDLTGGMGRLAQSVEGGKPMRKGANIPMACTWSSVGKLMVYSASAAP